MTIRRYFTEDNLVRVKKDFRFLLDYVRDSYGEYDFAIREDYFNLYYKGHSISKVTPQNDGTYMVSVHSRFFENTSADNKIHYSSKRRHGEYSNLILPPVKLHPFFQKKHMLQFSSRVSELPSGELGFEQAIITDNLHRKDFIIIDRQITDTELKRSRLDLLAIRQKEENKYHFLLLEVKLGKNSELKGQVKSQLDRYIQHVENHFDQYKLCYEKHLLQKVELGLIKQPKAVQIEKPIKGMILVGSYSGIAEASIKKLKDAYPNLEIIHFRYAL